jgi:hypothetical protein
MQVTANFRAPCPEMAQSQKPQECVLDDFLLLNVGEEKLSGVKTNTCFLQVTQRSNH